MFTSRQTAAPHPNQTKSAPAAAAAASSKRPVPPVAPASPTGKESSEEESSDSDAHMEDMDDDSRPPYDATLDEPAESIADDAADVVSVAVGNCGKQCAA